MKFNRSILYLRVIFAILLISLLFLGFYLGIKYQQAIAPKDSQNNSQKSTPIPSNGSKGEVKSDQLVAKWKYENEVLKYSGSVQLPTPCHELKNETRVLESFPEQVQIRLLIVNPPPDVFCIQVISSKEFSGEVKVSPQAIVSVWLNGKRVE